MTVIKRVGLNSAFKVGAITGLIIATIAGLLMVLMQGFLLSILGGLGSAVSDGSFNRGDLEIFMGASIATACIFYVMYVVFSAIAGGIAGLLWAFAYNLAARWVGGLEIELADEAGKGKRGYAYDDIYE